MSTLHWSLQTLGTRRLTNNWEQNDVKHFLQGEPSKGHAVTNLFSMEDKPNGSS